MGLEIEKLIEREKTTMRTASLFALTQALSKQLLQTWKLSELPGGTPELLEQVEERALRQANVLGGSHAFVLEAYNEAEKVIGSEVFRVTAEILPNGQSLVSEPPNEVGAFAQMMRHNEAQARVGVQQFQAYSNAAQRLFDSSTKHSAALEARLQGLLERMETLVLGEYESKIALAKVEADAKLKQAVVERVGNILPEVVGSFTGKISGTPGAAAAIKAKAAFSSLTGEQLQTILGALNEDQRIALLGLMKSLAADSEGKGPANGTAKSS
jgi:hypothetical protein